MWVEITYLFPNFKMDKLFYPSLSWACDYLPMLGLKLIHVSKRCPLYHRPGSSSVQVIHDDVIKWKHFPRYWPFVQGIHWSPVNSPHKGQWCGALMFSLICAWIKGWIKKSWDWWFEMLSCPLRRHRNGWCLFENMSFQMITYPPLLLNTVFGLSVPLESTRLCCLCCSPVDTQKQACMYGCNFESDVIQFWYNTIFKRNALQLWQACPSSLKQEQWPSASDTIKFSKTTKQFWKFFNKISKEIRGK